MPVMVLDPIREVNLVLCVIIFILGYLGFRKKKDPVPLYIGIAFGLFGVSHLLTILGYKDALTTFLITIRTIAYLMVVLALYNVVKKKK